MLVERTHSLCLENAEKPPAGAVLAACHAHYQSGFRTPSPRQPPCISTQQLNDELSGRWITLWILHRSGLCPLSFILRLVVREKRIAFEEGKSDDSCSGEGHPFLHSIGKMPGLHGHEDSVIATGRSATNFSAMLGFYENPFLHLHYTQKRPN